MISLYRLRVIDRLRIHWKDLSLPIICVIRTNIVPRGKRLLEIIVIVQQPLYVRSEHHLVDYT